MHLELVSANATAPGSSGAAAVPLAGDSLVAKNSKTKASIVALWCDYQAAGFVQVITPSAHDTTRGYRARVLASEVDMRLPLGTHLEVEPQETMSVTVAGSAVAGDVETACMLVQYPDLPGLEQRMIGWADALRRIDALTTVDCTINPTAAGYADELITAESDLLRANRDYVWLGYETSAECAAVYMRGPDLGNVKLGGPGNDTESDLTSGWWGLVSRATGKSCMPVFSSGNKSATYVGIAGDENIAGVGVTLFLGLLGK